MLWTAGGLWLLFGLGGMMGASAVLFVTCPVRKDWRNWMFVLAMAAAGGASYLIFQWMGPAGGGG